MRLFSAALLFAAIGCLPLAPLNAADRPPAIAVEVEQVRNVKATECYVLFLLTASGDDLQTAKQKLDASLAPFLAQGRKDFPAAQWDILTVNAGTRDYESFRPAYTQYVPAIGRVLLVTLPPDEDMALRLADAGVKAGLTLFCGSNSREGSFGAIYYGLKDPEAAIAGLFPEAVRLLRARGEQLARAQGRKIADMNTTARPVPFRPGYEVFFRGFRVVLPSLYCSTDPNRVRISLTVQASFALRDAAEKK